MIGFFYQRQKTLKLLATIYLVLLLFSHWQFPTVYIWHVAAFFSIAMNFTYVTEACSLRRSIGIEACVAGGLILTSLLGLLISPLFVIAAIFGHGCWDLAKHCGSGVPFYRWYTCSCFLVDFAYSVALFMYWFHTT